MTTTDPKLIERASLIADQAYSAGNLVTCDGYYEFDLDAAAAVIAAAINEAVQKERAGIFARMCAIEPDEELAGCPANWGDFLQILESELAAADERRAAMDALIADSADMIDVHKESQP